MRAETRTPLRDDEKCTFCGHLGKVHARESKDGCYASVDSAWTPSNTRRCGCHVPRSPRDESPDYSADMGYEPRGGNLYQPHTLQCSSGEFWRCKHGLTGFGEEMVWVGCKDCATDDPEAFARWSSFEATNAERIARKATS